MKIAVCLPFYKIMETAAVESLVSMLSSITNKGDKYDVVFVHGLGISLARNTMFNQILKEPEGTYDYVLSLDTDHIYSAGVLYQLIGDIETLGGLDFISAAYASRGNKEQIYAHLAIPLENDPKRCAIPLNSVSGIVDCYSVGFGFVVLKPAFIKKMKDTFGILFKWADDTYTGEDVYFCRNAAKLGARVCFDADARIWHLGTVKF